jgi:hypothetical protein
MSRPGTLLRALCRAADRETMAATLFRHTTTIGVRESAAHRYVLTRSQKTVETPYGPVRRKTSVGYGVTRTKYEYEDLARVAREQGVSLEQAQHLLENS